jgi:hypothetical protein
MLILKEMNKKEMDYYDKLMNLILNLTEKLAPENDKICGHLHEKYHEHRKNMKCCVQHYLS